MPDGINYDAFSEALNDKADRDLQNVDTVSGGDAVIEFQRPTAENGYTWYRKYASGWVEQGGILSVSSDSQAVATLPVIMADTNYTITNGFQDTSGTKRNNPVMILDASTTSITLGHQAGTTMKCHWQVSGMSAS